MAGQPGVYVTGLKELRRDLRKVAPELLPLLRDELKKAVDTSVVPRARAKMPRVTGAAQDSVRAVSGGNTVYVRAGGAKVPYFGWLDFGGQLLNRGRNRSQTIARPVIKGGRYLYPAIGESSAALAEAAGKASDTILDRFARGGP